MSEQKIDEYAESIFEFLGVPVTDTITKVYLSVKKVRDRLAPGRLDANAFAMIVAVNELVKSNPKTEIQADEPTDKTAKTPAEMPAPVAASIIVGSKISTTIGSKSTVGEVLSIDGAIITARFDGDSRPSREIDQSKTEVTLVKE